MYIDDMIDKISKDVEGVHITPTRSVNTLLYADDITVLAKTIEDARDIMRSLETYCAEEHLSINAGKTRYMLIYKHRKGKRSR